MFSSSPPLSGNVMPRGLLPVAIVGSTLREGNDRFGMAVVQDPHHRLARPHGILAGMEREAEVLSFSSPDGVEVRHLRAFVAVAEDLNFTRAAQRLYLSQPALSRQIRTLERVVGCELLRRSTHRVELTLAGSALFDRVRPVLAALDEAVATAQSVGGELNARIMTLWAPMIALATS